MSSATEAPAETNALGVAEMDALREQLADREREVAALRREKDDRRLSEHFADAEISAQMGAPRKSFPGTVEEKLAGAAALRGGDFLRGQTISYAECPHAAPDRCDDCWTRETETRWLKAVGRLPMNAPSVALYPTEERASQRANEPTSDAERARTGLSRAS